MDTNITNEQIETLANAASESGDLVQAGLCYLALGWTVQEMTDEFASPAIREALDSWTHPWRNQILNGTDEGRTLARVLCERAL